MKRAICLAACGLAGLILAGCSGLSGDRAPVRLQPVPVEVARPGSHAGSQPLNYSGTIEAAESIPLTFATMGTVARVLVTEGESVRKGQLLAELNAESSENALEMAQATLKQAEDAWTRLRPMHESGTLAEIKWVEIETDLSKARSAAAISKKNLQDCKLYSPVSGMVGRRDVEPGMVAVANIASITIVRIDRVNARVAVPEAEIAGISIGQQASIRVGALGNAEYSGRVEEVGVIADPLAHSYTVKIGMANPGHKIKPGMICSVAIADTSGHRRLVIPGRAVLVDEAGKNYLFIVDSNGLAARQQVTIGALQQNGIEIHSGLNPDDVVVVSGQHKLIDGTPVQIINR